MLIVCACALLLVLFIWKGFAACGPADSYTHEIKRIEYESGRVTYFPYVIRHGTWFFGLLKWKDRRGLSVDVEDDTIKRSRMSISDEATSSLPNLTLAYDAVCDAIEKELNDLKDSNIVKVITL
jgi:hypothetical protein